MQLVSDAGANFSRTDWHNLGINKCEHYSGRLTCCGQLPGVNV